MIRYVDETLLPLLKQVLKDDNIYTCRIGCLLKSYGLGYDFALFYLQTDNNGNPVGAAAKYYSDITIYLTNKSDPEEWQEFAVMTGFASLLCSKPFLKDVSFQQGMIMMLKNPADVQYNLPDSIAPTKQPDLSLLWNLLKSCEAPDFTVPEYEDFLLDMSHKLRHGTACCIALSENDMPVAAAMTVAQTDSSAIIGSVAAQKSHRNHGLGSFCVTSLCGMLSGKTIFIMRDKNLHEHFYNTLGFENTEPFYITLNPFI